jgi:hypothetical protein
MDTKHKVAELALTALFSLGFLGLNAASIPPSEFNPEPVTALADEEKKVVVEEEKEETWEDLSTAEKIKRNPNDCDLNTEWMWGDGSCHPKSPSDSKPTHVASVAPVSGSCHDWMNAAGITDQASAYTLIMRESGCNPNAVNPSSGACGIGQQLPCGKWPHAWNDPIGGMIDMQNYVFARYGTWADALAHSYAHNWY